MSTAPHWTDTRDAQATFRTNLRRVDVFLASFRAWMQHQDQLDAWRQQAARGTVPAASHFRDVGREAQVTQAPASHISPEN